MKSVIHAIVKSSHFDRQQCPSDALNASFLEQMPPLGLLWPCQRNATRRNADPRTGGNRRRLNWDREVTAQRRWLPPKQRSAPSSQPGPWQSKHLQMQRGSTQWRHPRWPSRPPGEPLHRLRLQVPGSKRSKRSLVLDCPVQPAEPPATRCFARRCVHSLRRKRQTPSRAHRGVWNFSW